MEGLKLVIALKDLLEVIGLKTKPVLNNFYILFHNYEFDFIFDFRLKQKNRFVFFSVWSVSVEQIWFRKNVCIIKSWRLKEKAVPLPPLERQTRSVVWPKLELPWRSSSGRALDTDLGSYLAFFFPLKIFPNAKELLLCNCWQVVNFWFLSLKNTVLHRSDVYRLNQMWFRGKR